MQINIFPRSTWIHIAAWAALVLLAISIFSLYLPFRLVFIHAVTNAILLAVIFYGSGYLINRFFERGNWALSILLIIALIALVSCPRTLINLQLLHILADPASAQGNPFSPLLRILVLVGVTSFMIAVFGASFQLIINRQRKQQQTEALLQEQQAAELDFLKAQINPHFLFNALNNIYSLVELRSVEAPKMLLKLSDLLRYAIYEGRKKEVSIQKEIQHIQNFIELFRMRCEHPANIQFQVADPILDCAIEPMILIPLVENCFKHTDFDYNEQAMAIITVEMKQNQVRFCTKNTFNQSDTQKDAVGGVGLDNINRRLQLRYPEQYRFTYGVKGGFFEVELIIQNPYTDHAHITRR